MGLVSVHSWSSISHEVAGMVNVTGNPDGPQYKYIFQNLIVPTVQPPSG